MNRSIRLQYDGAWYHVMNRGAERKPIFQNDHHRWLFLDLLAEIVEAYKIEILAYCLMTNHYHLLIRIPFSNLSEAMRHFGSVYTVRYNKSLGIDGPLFRGRYKSKLVQDNSYALHLVRYIHLNPYERFTLTDTSIDIEKYFSSKNHPPIIGTDEFIKKIKSTVDYQDLSCELSERKFFKPSITTIIAIVAMEFNVSVSSIKTPQRGVNLPSSCAFFIARKHFGYKLLELCEIAGIKCYQTVSHAARHFEFISQQDDKIAAMYLRALEIINFTASYPSEAQ